MNDARERSAIRMLRNATAVLREQLGDRTERCEMLRLWRARRRAVSAAARRRCRPDGDEGLRSGKAAGERYFKAAGLPRTGTPKFRCRECVAGGSPFSGESCLLVSRFPAKVFRAASTSALDLRVPARIRSPAHRDDLRERLASNACCALTSPGACDARGARQRLPFALDGCGTWAKRVSENLHLEHSSTHARGEDDRAAHAPPRGRFGAYTQVRADLAVASASPPNIDRWAARATDRAYSSRPSRNAR